MRYAARVDANQAEIVQALRDAGLNVWTMHRAGDGLPDLAVSCPGGSIHLVEVKRLGEGLTKREADFHDMFRDADNLHIVFTASQALALFANENS